LLLQAITWSLLLKSRQEKYEFIMEFLWAGRNIALPFEWLSTKPQEQVLPFPFHPLAAAAAAAAAAPAAVVVGVVVVVVGGSDGVVYPLL
jgi:hypothetical protein